MRSKKRLLLIFVTAILIVLCSASVSFAFSFPLEGSNLRWGIDYEDEVLTISGTGDMPDYSMIQDQPWYDQTQYFNKVVIEEGVTSIGRNAFGFCDITSVSIPNSVTIIGNRAFEACNFTSITIPDSVTSIGAYAFYNCFDLVNITIPNSVTDIGSGAFYSCRSLDDITIPDGVTSIAKDMFNDCRSLTNITIPDSVTSIDDYAFYGSGITDIIIPNNVTYIGKNAFRYCSSLKKALLSENITSIDDYAFYESGITDIIIPNSVTYIGNQAFGMCTSLNKVLLSENITSIYDYPFLSSTQVFVIEDSPTADYFEELYGTENNYNYNYVYKSEGHYLFDHVTIEPTCEVNGEFTSECVVCGEKETSVIHPLGHNYTLSYQKDPTCIEKGFSQYTCQNCYNSYGEEIDALGHDYVETVIEPTKYEGGYTLHECSRCGDSYKDNETDPVKSEEPSTPADSEKPTEPSIPSIPEPSTTEETEPLTFEHDHTLMCLYCSMDMDLENATNGKITWKSSDPKVAEISQDGVVKALKEGTVTITATDSKYSAECILDVIDFAYLGGVDDRHLHRKISEATTQNVRVYAYRDTMGANMVVTYINFKIISNFTQVGLHNLTTGEVYYDSDIDSYFDGMISRRFGASKIMAMSAKTDFTFAKIQILDGNCRYYDPNEVTEEEPTSSDSEKTETATPTKDKTSEDTKSETKTETKTDTKTETKTETKATTDATKQMGSDGTALGKGASAAAANKAITKAKGDKDLKGSVFNKLKVEQSKATKTSVTIKWKKVKGAKKYVIYAGKSGKSYKVKKVATLKNTKTKYTLKKYNKKKLTKGTYYKFAVVALNSKGKVITSSKFAHVATLGKNSKSNPAKVTVSSKVKKNKITLKVKKTFKLKGAYKASAKKYKIRKVLAMRYESTNPKVARVSSKGVITAKKKGTCYIFAYAQNGMYQRIKVTVKN